MQIKMRKVLAVLACVAMLCTLLPLSVFAASNDGFVTNGDFETGDLTGWKNSYSGVVQSAVVHGGSYAHKTTNTASKYQGMMQQNPVKVAANSDYTVTFWYYYEGNNATGSGASFYLYAQTTDNSTNIKSITSYPAAANTWYQVTHTFNTGANTEIALVWSNRMANDGGTYYFDDVVMTGPAPSDEPVINEVPTDFGRIENGGFEEATGGMTLKYGSRTTEQAYSGSYSLKSNSQTKYGVYAYTTFDCVANTDYKFSFKIKLAGDATAASTNQRLYVKASDESTVLKQLNITDATTDWKTYSVTVNSGENTTMYFSFAQGIDNGGTCYIDDVIVEGPAPETPAPEGNETPSNDGYIINGDFETGDANAWTAGTGATIDYSQKYAGNFSMHMTANSGSYAYGLSQTVAVEKNTNYTVSFYYTLVDGTNIRLYICDGDKSATNIKPANGDAQPVAYGNSSSAVNGVWKQATISFNSGENESIFLKIGGGSAGYGECYLDNFVMTKDATQPDPDAPTGYTGSYPETMTSGADIRFMTYNVLVGQDTANGGYSWGSAITGRPEKACAMINYYKPDVIALEEFSGEWYDYFVANMPDYAFGEMTSADSQNNGKLYTCIAYNVNTINLLDTDLFRNTVSRWGTQGMRYVNVGFCEVIATGEKFIAAVTHPDAGDLVGTEDINGDGVAEEGAGYWRPQQLEEAAAYVAGLSETHKMPVVWGGDFNSGLDGTYDDNVSWYKVADAGFTDATAGRYIDHIFYNGMATHLYETTVADAAVNGASDHKAVFADIQFLDEYATPIKDAKDYIKTQGRNTLKDGALWLDFSASGIEFSANCEGKVALNLNVKSLKQTDSYGGLYFTVIVDGVKVDRAQCHITSTGNVELVLAENLPAGNHTFEVYRQTEHRGAEVGISSIVMNGDFNEKPEDNRLYIEFIGDSISTGFGALGTTSDSDGGSPKWQDATAAYPYLTAKALGADFSDVCYSGIGAKYGWQDPNMLNFYPYQRWQYDRNTQYNFNARQPDVVVIALGTNDIAMEAQQGITVEQRLAGYQELLDLVRAKNPNSKIVWIYGMMKDDDNARIPAIIEENGGAAEGLYSLELVTNTAGAGWHPSAAGQQKFADDLVAFLNSDVLVKYVGDEMYDNEGVMDDLYSGEYNALTSRTEEDPETDPDTGLGLAFKFQLNADGIAVKEGTENVADLTNATIDAFGDGNDYKLLDMGTILTNDPAIGLKNMTLADATNNKKVIKIAYSNAKDGKFYMQDLESGYATFAARIINIPEDKKETIVYARAYYVFEYEGRQIVVYDDVVQANYIHKYDSNDGVLEW